MKTRTLSIYTCIIGALLFLAIACSSDNKFTDAGSVVETLNQHQHTVTDCEDELAFVMLEADSGKTCTVSIDGIESARVDFYTFDGNAEDACDDNMFCSFLVAGESIIYESNLLVVIYNPESGKWLTRSITEDLEDYEK